MAKDNAKYTGFIGSLEIKAIMIPRLSWEIMTYPPPDSRLNNDLELHINDAVKASDNAAFISADLKMDGKIDPGNEIFMHLQISVTIHIEFNPEYYSEEVLELYQQRNAIFSLMAVLREQVRIATFQMGLPPFILPAFKIMPHRKSSPLPTSDNKIKSKKINSGKIN